MADGTKIEWTDATWQIVTGCTIKSPGCLHCYAMKLAAGRLRDIPSRVGLTHEVNGHKVWTGEVRFNEGWLDQPLSWTRPRNIFVAAHGDLFHEGVIDHWLDRVWAVMILAKQHKFQVLTKRPERAMEYLSGGRPLYERVLRAADPIRDARPRLTSVPIDDPAFGAFHRNIWIGTSVERQQEADERRGPLKQIADMGFNTWVSYEPALGSVDWSGWEFIRWMVSGGESGPDARPTDSVWHRACRDWCIRNAVPYFMKQWGSWHADALRYTDMEGRCPPPNMKIGKKAAGALLDGREWREFPA